MKRQIITEVCCTSLDDALEAQRGGANRIELNCSLAEGGLTPSTGLLSECKKAISLPVMAMTRPRGGGFCYSPGEVKTIFRDAELLLKNGADGIVFGFLKSDGTIDIPRCKTMLSIIGKQDSVFHRAIDVCTDSLAALDELISLGATRVLTSGRQITAVDGAETIRKMIQQAAGRIEILVCGKIRANNVKNVLEQTGCTQIHFACNKECPAPIPVKTPIRFNAAGIPEEHYRATDGNEVVKIVNICKSN